MSPAKPKPPSGLNTTAIASNSTVGPHSSEAQGQAIQAHQAWRYLTQTLGYTLPTALARAEAKRRLLASIIR